MELSLPEWPLFGLADDVRPALKAAMDAGAPAALVTLYKVEGGGPRPAGAQMLFAEGAACGFLSGGCVESDVAIHAAETLADGAPRRMIYGEGSPWPDIQLLCGARLELLVEKIAPDDVAAARLIGLMEARHPAVWTTDGRERATEAAPTLDHEYCIVSEDPFLISRLYDPTPRLAVVGSDPTALAIASLGAQAGFETTLVRPKGPVEPPPLAGVAYSRSEPAEAFADVGLDPWTAVAVATHDWEVDHDALVAALPSLAPYVGVLGARRRLPERLERLADTGITEDQIARLKAPIGLDLGGKSPWEIAVAVIAEILVDAHARSTGRTSSRAPISAGARRRIDASAPAKNPDPTAA